MLLITLNSMVGSRTREVQLGKLPEVAADSPGGSGRAFSELPIEEQRELVRDRLDVELATRAAAYDRDQKQAPDVP